MKTITLTDVEYEFLKFELEGSVESLEKINLDENTELDDRFVKDLSLALSIVKKLK